MLGFIGAGNMARAIISGLVNQGMSASDIIVSDVNESQLAHIKTALRVCVTQNNQEVVEQAKTIILAVKPQNFITLLEEIRSYLRKDQLIFSIAAGVTVDNLQSKLSSEFSIVRAMPNLAAMVSSAITALFANQSVNSAQRKEAEKLAMAIGSFAWLDREDDMHAVTALSGSGPGYFFYMMQALIEAGIKEGLNDSLARRLVVETAEGAAKFVLANENLSLREMVNMVCSRGGTTEAAISYFEEKGLTPLLELGVQAACTRSRKLSEGA